MADAIREVIDTMKKLMNQLELDYENYKDEPDESLTRVITKQITELCELIDDAVEDKPLHTRNDDKIRAKLSEIVPVLPDE